MRAALALFSALLVLPAAGALGQEPADAVYYNGRIITVWEARPVVQAVAIRGNRFLRVGSNQEVLKLAGPSTRKVDLRGRCVVPGLIESHVHPVGAALSERDGPVPVMHSIAEVQEYMRKVAARLPADKLVFVPKVYATRLKERRYPTRQELDAAVPRHPAVADNGYAAVLNSVALARAGVTRSTPEPDNGKIIRDPSGEPTGLILGARQLIGRIFQDRTFSHQDELWALRTIQKQYNSAGITSIVDRGQAASGVRLYQELQKLGELTVRATITYRIGSQGTPSEIRRRILEIPFVTGFGDDRVRIGAIKVILDGGILIGTAFLRAPYGTGTEIYGYKDPDYRGVFGMSMESLIEMARTANELGWQMTAHTAGGGAIDRLLDAYEEADKVKPIRERRFTVTHGNFPDARAIQRARKMGVIYDMQPAWHHFDGPAIAPAFGPDRMRNFIPLRSLIDAGVTVVGGSDHMIRMDPRLSLNAYHPFFGRWMAVTRKTAAGTVLNPEQRITREEALRLWTINGAYGTFEEKKKGSIEPGKLADFAVIDRDYLTCPEDEIKDIDALLTVMDGRVVYERK
ncbi:MAG: amidohydrolase [Bryobacterales bacterium]|nr:amidohydrolase [Bryobacterales bacterium]